MPGTFIAAFRLLRADRGSVKAVLEEIREDAIAFGKEVFKETFAAIFDKYPGLTDVSWTAYTPSWNDGDPCSFSSNHQYPELNDCGDDSRDIMVEQSFDGCPTCRKTIDAGNFCSTCGSPRGEYTAEVATLPEMSDDQWEACKDEVRAFLREFSKDDMRMLFGEDIKVIIRQGGVTIDDYNDYNDY